MLSNSSQFVMVMFFCECNLVCSVREKGNTTTAATVGAGVLDKVVVKDCYGVGSDNIKDVKPGFSKSDAVECIRGDVLGDYIYVGTKGSTVNETGCDRTVIICSESC